MAERSLVVVAYDITDDKRRVRIAQLLLSFGARVEASVYELWLTKRDLENMWHRITREAQQGDLIRCYVLCDGCVRRVRSRGLDAPKEEIAFFA